MKVHNEILRNIARNCSLFGIQEGQVYEAAGIHKDSILLAEGMQDWKAGVSVWDAALRLTSYPYLSMTFGKLISFSVLGWIAPLATSSNTLKLALKSIADFFPLMGDMFEYELVETSDEGMLMYYRPSPVWEEYSPETSLLAAEHAMALTVSLANFLCGKIIRVHACMKGNPSEERKRLYEDFFTTVELNSNVYALYFDSEATHSKCISANPMIYEDMLKLCREQLEKTKSISGIRSEVLRIFNSRQAYVVPKIAEIAAMLNMSTRTLQRKLKEDHTSFQMLLEEFQIAMARTLLQKPGIQVQEVAFMLGFSSPQSFSRTFKRRTGKAPRA